MEIPILGRDGVHWFPEEEVSPEDRSLAGSHLNAFNSVLEGNREAFAPFEGRDAHGIHLLTDPARAIEMWINDEIDITEFYTDPTP